MENNQTLDSQALLEALNNEKEWAKSVIFDEYAQIICQKNAPTSEQELKEFLKAYDTRDNTIGAGFTLLKNHYDVHRFHPPLIYGRRGNADVGEGISLARGTSRITQKKIYLLITYELPIISARAVPQQINFFNKEIGELDQF